MSTKFHQRSFILQINPYFTRRMSILMPLAVPSIWKRWLQIKATARRIFLHFRLRENCLRHLCHDHGLRCIIPCLSNTLTSNQNLFTTANYKQNHNISAIHFIEHLVRNCSHSGIPYSIPVHHRCTPSNHFFSSSVLLRFLVSRLYLAHCWRATVSDRIIDATC